MRHQYPKAYLRVDPNIDSHPDPGTIVLLMVWANRQGRRGRFKTLAVVEKVIGRKRVAAAVERGDLVKGDEGYYLAGWDEWQEGDKAVGDRMREIRGERETPGALRTATWRLRTAVFERDRFTCRYCGNSEYERRWLIAEHVIPIPDGPTTLKNLVTACRPCNKKKGGRTPEQAGMILLPQPSDASRDVTVTRHPSEALRRSGVKTETETENEIPTAVAAGVPAPRPDTWLTPYGQAWQHRWGKECLPPYPQMAGAWGKGDGRTARESLGEPEFLARWVRYLDSAQEAKWAKPASFLTELGQWAARPGGTGPAARASPPRASVGDRTLAALERFDARRQGGTGPRSGETVQPQLEPDLSSMSTRTRRPDP